MIYTAERYANTVYAVIMSQAGTGTVLIHLNLEWHKQCHTIAQGLSFSGAKVKFQWDHSQLGRKIEVGTLQSVIF